MNKFISALEEKLIQSKSNNFGVDNYDEYRYGVLPTRTIAYCIFIKIKKAVKKIIGYKKADKLKNQNEFLTKYGEGLQRVYNLVNAEGQELLLEIIAYRLLGYNKIKLSTNNEEYWAAIEIVNALADIKDSYDPHFKHFILQKYDLRKIGYDIRLYSFTLGVVTDFIFEQYAFKSGDKNIVDVEKGDTVLDLGACWGDTALYFACKTGEQGKVYSFEFIPENIKVFNMNTSLNPDLIKHIEMIQHPVSEISGDKIYYKDNGPGSRIEIEPFDGQTGFAFTISIDDFIKKNGIRNVDFIKMDIEGSEPIALKGAIETIRRFKPKLAIAIYHNMDDFVNIPNWIMGLNLGYKLYLGHYTIHSEETVIFAKVGK